MARILFSEFDDGDKTVAACAVPFFRVARRACSERCERTPISRSKSDRNARRGIVKRMHDVAGQSLKTIDFAPRVRQFPKSAVSLSEAREKASSICAGVAFAKTFSCDGMPGLAPKFANDFRRPKYRQRSRDQNRLTSADSNRAKR